MAEDPKPAGAKVPKPAEQAEQVASAPQQRPDSAYPDSTHLSQAQGMYGQNRHVVAGAIYLIRQDHRRTADLTKAEVADSIKTFLERKLDDTEGEQA